MTKLVFSLAALATTVALVATPPASAQQAAPLGVVQTDSANIRLAQADVTVRVGTPAAKKRVVVKKKVVVKPRRKRVIVTTPAVRSRTVIATPSRHCRTVTVRKQVAGRTVVSKTRRCG